MSHNDNLSPLTKAATLMPSKLFGATLLSHCNIVFGWGGPGERHVVLSSSCLSRLWDS